MQVQDESYHVHGCKGKTTLSNGSVLEENGSVFEENGSVLDHSSSGDQMEVSSKRMTGEYAYWDCLDVEKEVAKVQEMKEKSLTRLTTLWDNEKSKPIMDHAELERILRQKLGFFPQPVVQSEPSFSPAPAPDHDPYNVAWKEYTFPGKYCYKLRPRLPYPKMDGLHVKVYNLFIYNVGIYIGHVEAQNLFHVREIASPAEKLNIDEFDFDEFISKCYRKGSLDAHTEFYWLLYNIKWDEEHKADDCNCNGEGKMSDHCCKNGDEDQQINV